MSDEGVTSSSIHWPKISLSDVFSVSSGEGLSQTQMRPGNHPVYGGNGITGFHDTFLFETSRLIIGRVGEYCGKVYVTRHTSWVTDNALIATFHDNAAYLPFWFYYLNHLGLNNFAFAAAQPVITGGILERISGCVPPLPQQRKIARILTTLDNVIAQTEALIAKYQAIKQGLMHDLFTRGVDATGKLRPPQSEAPELYKQSEFGWIPKEWRACTLAVVVPRAEYGISVSLDDSEGIPVLRMNNLTCGRIDISEIKRSRSPEAMRLPLGDRDVLFNRTNSIEHVGRTSLWRAELPVASFASYLVRLVPNHAEMTPEYLVHWLNLPATQTAIRQFATPGVHQVNINPTNLRRSMIGLPSTVGEQLSICRVVQQQESQVSREESYLAKLQETRTGLMQDLLTGKVPVKADEPEEITS